MILRDRKQTNQQSGLSSDQPMLALSNTDDTQFQSFFNPIPEVVNQQDAFKTPSSKHDVYLLLGLDKPEAKKPLRPSQKLPTKWRHHITVCRRSLTKALSLNLKLHKNLNRIIKATKPPEVDFKLLGINPAALTRYPENLPGRNPETAKT